MGILAAAGWAVMGGLCVEALALLKLIKNDLQWSWRRPIPQGLTAYVISVMLRIGIGAGLAAAAADSHQVSGGFVAFGLGVGAPLILEKLASGVPLTGTLPSEPRQSSVVPPHRASAEIHSTALGDVEAEHGKVTDAR
jgi:hypothetical protein